MKNRKFGGKNAVCKSKFNKFALGAVLVSSIISSACANGLFIGADGEYNFNSKYNFFWNPSTWYNLILTPLMIT